MSVYTKYNYMTRQWEIHAVDQGEIHMCEREQKMSTAEAIQQIAGYMRQFVSKQDQLLDLATKRLKRVEAREAEEDARAGMTKLPKPPFTYGGRNEGKTDARIINAIAELNHLIGGTNYGGLPGKLHMNTLIELVKRDRVSAMLKRNLEGTKIGNRAGLNDEEIPF